MAAARDPHPKMMPSDIETYARHVPGMDPSRYFDSQSREVWQAALKRWPFLAQVLYPDAEDESSG